ILVDQTRGWRPHCEGPALVVTPRLLRDEGALAISMRSSEIEWTSVAQERGERPWSMRPSFKREQAASAKRQLRSVATNDAHEATLHLHPIGAEDAGFMRRVGGFECDLATALAQALERCLSVVDERHDDVAGLRVFRALNEDGIAVQDAGIDHRV